MLRRIGWAVFVSAVSLGSAGSIHASDPFEVAQRAINELYVKPLHLFRAQLRIEAEPFSADCRAAAITIRVLLPTKKGRREVLKVDAVVIDDRLRFLGASGSALHEQGRSAADEAMKGAITFLSQVNGWKPIEEPLRRGAKKGYVERRMRESKPGADEPLIIIVFDRVRGVPIVIGAPPPPDFDNCGK